MKKTAKNLAMLLLAFSAVFALCIPAFAVGQPSKPKATAAYNSIALSWSKVSGADGYEVYVLSGKNWKKLASTKSVSYTHKKLKINTTYKYRVRAYDKTPSGKLVYGKYSQTVSAKTSLAKVTGLKSGSATVNSFTLSWKKVSGATGYKLYVYSGGKWVYKTKTTSNSIKISGAKLGKTYQYRVRAYRTVGEKNCYGPYSSTVSAKCVLPSPSGVKLTAATRNSATLKWKAAEKATGYQVYLQSGSEWIKKPSVTSAKCTLKDLDAGTKYTVRLRSFRKVGDSYVYSAYTSFSFNTLDPKDPTVVPINPAEISSRYNQVVNNAKKEQNVTIRKRSTVSVKCTDCSVSILVGSVNSIINAAAKPIDKTITVTNGKAADQDGNSVDLSSFIPPASRKSALKESRISSAEVYAEAKAADGYTMKIILKAEKSSYDGTNTVNPKGHNSCLDPLNPATMELPLGAEIAESEMTYSYTMLIAYVNGQGKLDKLTVNLPFEGHATGRLQNISLTVGFEGTENDVYEFQY